MSKHILQIAPTPFFSDRGCHIRIEGIVRCLTELGFTNTVCTYHHGRDITDIKTKRIKHIANYTQTEAGPSKYKLLADWRLLLLTIKEYRQLKPHVIHAHLHEGLLIGLLVKWLFFWRRTVLIGDMQGSLYGELNAHGSFNKKPYLKWPVKMLEWFLMKCANHIVCSSEHSLEIIKSGFSANSNDISLAQDGANSVAPLSKSRQSELQKKLGIPKGKTVVIYSGALLESKGLNELKEIIRLSKNQNEIHFLIIGYPIENLQTFLEEESLQNNCTLTGQVDFERLSDYLNLAHIAIDPKNNDSGEGSGKMLNYLACGLAVVAFNSINNKRYLSDDLELAKDVNQLVEQLNRLAEDTTLRKKIASSNIARFEKNYSWEVCKSQLNTVYSKF